MTVCVYVCVCALNPARVFAFCAASQSQRQSGLQGKEIGGRPRRKNRIGGGGGTQYCLMCSVCKQIAVFYVNLDLSTSAGDQAR